MDLGEYENDIQEYDKVIQLDPNYAHAYLHRGYSYDELGSLSRWACGRLSSSGRSSLW